MISAISRFVRFSSRFSPCFSTRASLHSKRLCAQTDMRDDMIANMFALAEHPNNLGIEMIMENIRSDYSLAHATVNEETLLMRAVKHLGRTNSRLARELLPISNIYYTGALKYYSEHNPRRVRDSALHRILESTDHEFISLLLTKMEIDAQCPVRQLDIEKYFRNSRHLITLAIDTRKDHACVSRLIKLGADVDGVPHPLVSATSLRDPELVEMLLLAGADKSCEIRRDGITFTDWKTALTDWKTSVSLRGYKLVPVQVHTIDDDE